MIDFKEHKIMTPTGLTLDNLVYNRHGEVHALRIMDFHAWDHPRMNQDYGFYGIPLTPEWLIKMGFKNTQQGTMAYPEVWRIIYCPVLVKTALDLQNRDQGEYRWFEGNTNVAFHYVHQIQNFYFALAGEELTIK